MNLEETLQTTHLPASRKLVLNILVTANYIDDRLAEALKGFGITIAQFNVLRILRGQKGEPANLANVQERMVCKMSNTTRLVDKLILKDLAKRVTCKENRRKVEISITEEGLEFLKKVDPVIDGIEKEIFSRFSPQEAALLNNCLIKIRTEN